MQNHVVFQKHGSVGVPIFSVTDVEPDWDEHIDDVKSEARRTARRRGDPMPVFEVVSYEIPTNAPAGWQPPGCSWKPDLTPQDVSVLNSAQVQAAINSAVSKAVADALAAAGIGKPIETAVAVGGAQ